MSHTGIASDVQWQGQSACQNLALDHPRLLTDVPGNGSVHGHPSVKLSLSRIGESVAATASNSSQLNAKPLR
jgi:hypothetical protein